MRFATPPVKRIVLPLLVAAASALLAGLLSQCRWVNDSLVAARPSAAGGNPCISQCAMAYNDSISDETALHLQNVASCSGDSLCLVQEEQRHDAAVDRIQAGRADCINGCHHQGGGSGGQ